LRFAGAKILQFFEIRAEKGIIFLSWRKKSYGCR